MQLIHAVLASNDEQYVQAILDYLHQSPFHSKVRLTVFTRLETFLIYINECQSLDFPSIVLGEAHFFRAWPANCSNKIMKITLCECEHEIGPLCYFKYQPVSSLFESILGHCRPRQKKTNGRFEQQTLVIGIGCSGITSGKTTVCINMAKQWSSIGYSVFYLNLESIDSSTLFFQQKGDVDETPLSDNRFTRLMYEMKSSRETNRINTIDEYIMRDERMNVYRFYPNSNPKEIMEMNKEHTLNIIDYLRGTQKYDMIIIDGDSSWNERKEAVIACSDVLVWLLTDDFLAMYKLGKWLLYQERNNVSGLREWFQKAHFVINKCRGDLVNPLPREDMHISHMLSYIPSWKQSNSKEISLTSPIFQRDIQQLCELIIKNDHPFHFT